MGLKDRIQRALRTSEEAGVRIPLKDGGYATFSPAEMEEAYLRALAVVRGEDVEPHPANLAAAGSSDLRWRVSFWARTERGFVIEDMSRGANEH